MVQVFSTYWLCRICVNKSKKDHLFLFAASIKGLLRKKGEEDCWNEKSPRMGILEGMPKQMEVSNTAQGRIKTMLQNETDLTGLTRNYVVY